MTSRSRLTLAFVVSLVLAALSACGVNSSSQFGGGADDGSGATAGTGGADDDGGTAGSILSSSGGSTSEAFTVEPEAPQIIAVAAGQNTPTVTFASFYDGSPIAAGWGVDRGEIGYVDKGPVEQTMFTPRGTTGGLVTLYANLNGNTLERQVMVQLSASQNGPNTSDPLEQAQVAGSVPQLTQGGGIGGVGGEGLGPALTDPATLAALNNPSQTGQAQQLRLLYPYDATVWPRGLLAPLLQWDWTLGDADAVRIELETTSGSFSYSGTFGRPAILDQTGDPMTRHPIPQGAWKMATNSAGGKTLDNSPELLVMRVTIAHDGIGYGPLTQTWRVAPGRPSGSIYYNSYGTQLAKNYGGALGGDGMFGGAVLSIKIGDTAPALIAGQNGSIGDCRVCHSASADGSRLIAQHGNNYSAGSQYLLTPQSVTQLPIAGSTGWFSALTRDGAFAVNPGGQLLDLVAGGTPAPVSGLAGLVSDLGTPAFSPDGARVVFNPYYASGIPNPMQKLVAMSFNQATGAFSSPVTLVDLSGSPSGTRPGWGAFFPDSSAVVYQHQITTGNEPTYSDLRTRSGAKSYLAWVPANGSGPPAALDQLNGKNNNGVYLPSLAQPNNLTCYDAFYYPGNQVGAIDPTHGDDVNLNYEPTVNPVASGGYAWVVFTSRRMYGNVADIPPFCSDPRGVDLVENVTTKKLWVAAIDLNAPPGTDPSHPGFYLPAQELLAGNARGFWALEPCRLDGESCETGDQCCNGFCSPSGTGPDDPLECAPPAMGGCSQPQEACDTAADCCDPTNECINGFCAVAPQ